MLFYVDSSSIFFPKLSKSLISIHISLSDLTNFKRSSKIILILCGFNPYLPLYSLVRDYLIKLVEFHNFFIIDCVFSTTSWSRFVKKLLGSQKVLGMLLISAKLSLRKEGLGYNLAKVKAKKLYVEK